MKTITTTLELATRMDLIILLATCEVMFIWFARSVF
jgi:hypothetical protein